MIRLTSRIRALTFAAHRRMVIALIMLLGIAAELFAQVVPPKVSAVAALPEPIYWKQNLFLIPYQWSSAADPAAARAVWLFLSKDSGTTWQKISEALPHVKAFNYHAETDGAYAFAIRTVDATGRVLPEGPYRPELYVIVDTNIPRIEELAAHVRGDGQVALRWRAFDANLDPQSWKIEAQSEPDGAWFAVDATETGRPATSTDGVTRLLVGEALWQPPTGTRPIAFRGTVLDRAGNSAVFQTGISPTPLAGFSAGAVAGGFDPAWSASERPTTDMAGVFHDGWTGLTESGSQSPSAQYIPPAPLNQPWPASETAHAPFRLAEPADRLPSDSATTYGQPAVVRTPPVSIDDANLANEPAHGSSRSGVHPSSTSELSFPQDAERYAMTSDPTHPALRPLEPFRTASLPGFAQEDPPADPSISPPPGVEAKQVGARTFALEYELSHQGDWGVSRVELWGTRDGGQTWRRFAEDDDHRSPLYVTVDDAGVYGFRLVVEAAGGPAANVPRPGDLPELWVAVDLRRPHVELVSIQPGRGNTSDQIVLRWRAADDNLEPRPIGLFYSSRPAGPWSAIATGLENTGEYAWRVERYVPPRVYLRLEARDQAGNVSAFQTAEPIDVDPPQVTGVLRSVL